MSASRSLSGPEGDEEQDLTSELEGATVVFAWDAEEEEYTVEYAEGEEGDEELLEELEWDMDASFLLPDDDVEEGTTWDLGPELADLLTDLAGDLHLEDEDEDEEEDPMSELIDEASDAMEGEFQATYAGMREVDGVQVAAFDLSAELTGEAENTEDVDDEGPNGESIEGTTSLSVVLETVYEGTLLWSVDGNRMHALDVEGSVTMTNVIEASIDFGEQFQLEQFQQLTFEGELEFSAAVEAL